MANSQTTADIDTQIARLEGKLNNLFNKIQEAQSITVESPSIEQTTQKVTGKSRKEILIEYEKEYLARLEAQRHAEAKIQREAEELESKKQQESLKSPRGALPKGF